MMEIWLDTIDLEIIADAAKTGIISGVTTNPSILSHSPNVSQTLDKLLSLQPGPIAVQVTATNPKDMIHEGRIIAKYNERFIVKVPVTHHGLIAISQLRKENITVMGTGIIFPHQVLLATSAQANYLAPYFSHMGEDAQEHLKTMQNLTSAKILAASVKTIEHILICAKIGIHAITIKADFYRELLKANSKVDDFTDKFLAEWAQRQHGISIAKCL